MFGGIVEAIGHIREIEELKEGLRFWIEAPFDFKEDTGVGGSISVNGACLTVTEWRDTTFGSDISPETLEKTTFGKLRVGDAVNVERALKLSDRLNGHMVTGHVDSLGELKAIEEHEAFSKMTFCLPREVCGDVVQKGSIAIDGVSLTVNEVSQDCVETMIIPETLKRTTLGQKKVGDPVQVELDLIGKYVKKWMHHE